ncbi:dihydroneopterin aldolase [Capnocytophaga sp. Marseille-Q4570]|jgi:7,8-dihydroneopterin aldolase/epimerase/oxygenase|uniref:7,8-dihydroneopterin aldolase n=1 Tax=Capnocytophaga bilenii TaxID=2819369 RepID=A0ABS3PWF4_9FLAO|nr:dihydroneopterin aldolase [Capnocytophaga bilenii]MBO1883676.1 dihydroneopterin aldolase [Capnocytophaga bilenii]
MEQIILKNIRVRSNHGCLVEEEQIGSDYRVDLKVTADLGKARSTDALEDTVDYVSLNRIVVEEMAVRAQLLEVVADRIVKRVFAEHHQVKGLTLKVAKINPPIGGDVAEVVLKIKEKRA